MTRVARLVTTRLGLHVGSNMQRRMPSEQVAIPLDKPTSYPRCRGMTNLRVKLRPHTSHLNALPMWDAWCRRKCSLRMNDLPQWQACRSFDVDIVSCGTVLGPRILFTSARYTNWRAWLRPKDSFRHSLPDPLGAETGRGGMWSHKLEISDVPN